MSKAVILEAVQEFAPGNVSRLAKLKKGVIASEAERLTEGSGWMPAVFQTEYRTESEGVPAAASDTDAAEQAADEVEAHALAT